MKYISQNNSTGANKGSKRCFSANGFSLLPLALRPRLFCLFATFIGLAIGLFACSNSTFATDPFLNVTIANSISLDLKPISTTGTFAKSDTTSNTISATTNYFAGYTLGIAASGTGVDAANLIQTAGEGNEQTIVGRISSIGTVTGVTGTGITEQEFSNANNTQYNNTWGYKVTNLNTTTSTNYLPAPTNTTSISMDTTNAANANTANNYNIVIGARVDAEIPKGSYTNTFVITAVANPIPYTINYNKNAEDTVTNMPTATSGSTTAVTITNAINNKVPVRTGYKFLGWCSTTTVIADNTDTCSGTIYNPNGGGTNRNYTLDQTGSNTNIILYAMWQRTYNVTFVAGSNIDLVIVADSSNNWRPYYTSGNTPVTRTVPAGTRLAVTVVPVANYILDSWTSDSGSTNSLTDPTLLTTTYTVGATDETLIATGKSGEYTFMQDIDLSIKDTEDPSESINCPTTGINVTDSRDKKSYTVAKFGNYCYMLSDLRLDNTMVNESGNIVPRVLTKDDSDIKDGGVTYTDPETGDSVTTTTFTMPNENWGDWYCRANMKHYDQGSGNNYSNEYYYNWYAAKANPYQCDDPTTDTNATSTNDGYALGSICPKGWTLPDYSNDVTGGALWNSGANPGMLATSGNFRNGRRFSLGDYGSWWSRSRGSINNAHFQNFSSTGIGRIDSRKFWAHSVRCMRNS